MTSEQLYASNKLADIPVQIEEAVNIFVLETLTVNQKDFDNRFSAAWGMLVVRTVNKVVNSPEFISRLPDAAISSY